MSKDMLGSLVRASVGLSQGQINLMLEGANRLKGESSSAWEAHLKRVYREGLPTDVKTPALMPSVLKLVNPNVSLDAIATYDPSGFKTRPGLWVSEEYHSRVGSKAKPIENLSAITLSSFDLVKNTYDKVIKADSSMPTNHVFESASEFVAYSEQMISKQPNGEEGDLLNNGYWNIFYFTGCVVLVGWDSDRRQWSVDAWNLGVGRWDAGNRVFSRN